MSHFFIGQQAQEGQTVSLTPEDSHHARNVLRLQPGEAVTVADPTGRKWNGKVESLSSKDVFVRILGLAPGNENKITLHLAHALLKRDLTEQVVQKCVELGVDHFHPFISSRTIVRPKKDRTNQRWQKIADEAAKQCGRSRKMTIHSVQSFEDLLQKSEGDLKILFWEEETAPLQSYLRDTNAKNKSAAWILIGPEGGISQEEVDRARDSGWISLSLGPRVLKADTATVAAVSLVQYELGNLSTTGHRPSRR